MKPLRVLLVDDDTEFLRHFQVLARPLFEVITAQTAGAALDLLRRESPAAVLLDVDLGAGADGLELLRAIRSEHPDLPVVMLSGDDRPQTVVEAMRAGAVDYVPKRPQLEILHLKVRQALDHAAWKIHGREIQLAGTSELVGSSTALAALRAEIARVAPTRVCVLVTGETGTGKELVARALHAASPRRAERLVVVSGAVGSDELFDAEFFGHERGAFTGALERRIGRFELADRGTLFLDEVGRMTPPRQAKLLRVIETGAIARVGGSQEIVCDVRWVCATNEDLHAKIQAGTFLEDLYHRINRYELRVPPLRDRLEDLPELARALLSRFAREENLPAPPELVAGALDPLRDYSWPGNVRELQGVLERGVISAGGGPLTAEILREATSRRAAPTQEPRCGESGVAAASGSITEFLDGHYAEGRRRLEEAFDRQFIEKALRRRDGNVTRTARDLGISRSQLHRRMKELGIQGQQEP